MLDFARAFQPFPLNRKLEPKPSPILGSNVKQKRAETVVLEVFLLCRVRELVTYYNFRESKTKVDPKSLKDVLMPTSA